MAVPAQRLADGVDAELRRNVAAEVDVDCCDEGLTSPASSLPERTAACVSDDGVSAHEIDEVRASTQTKLLIPPTYFMAPLWHDVTNPQVVSGLKLSPSALLADDGSEHKMSFFPAKLASRSTARAALGTISPSRFTTPLSLPLLAMGIDFVVPFSPSIAKAAMVNPRAVNPCLPPDGHASLCC